MVLDNNILFNIIVQEDTFRNHPTVRDNDIKHDRREAYLLTIISDLP